MLLIDDRAGSRDLIPLLPPESCKMMRLESGDAALFGYGPDGPYTYPIGIELKSIQDAVSCFYTGRLVQGQLPKMTELYKRIYLALYGDFQEGSSGLLEVQVWYGPKPAWVPIKPTTKYSVFDNWLNSLTETAKLNVKRASTLKEAATQIHNLYSFWTKDYDSHKSLMKFDKSQEPPLLASPTLKRLIAAQLPSIGWTRSGAVADHFSSVREMINASEEQWKQVTGIGPTIAKKIVAQINYSHPSNIIHSLL